MKKTAENYNVKEFQDYLMDGNYEKCSEYINNILEENDDLKFVYDEILKKSLYNVGELWEASKISVATEHLASAMIETILSEIYFKVFAENKIEKKVVVACTENEFHQVGVKMVSDIFEMNGWQVEFLGANTAIGQIIETIEKVNPDVLALSLSIPFNLPTLDRMLGQIKSNFPDLFIMVGGQAFLHGGFDVLEKFNQIIYKPNLQELDKYLKSKISR